MRFLYGHRTLKHANKEVQKFFDFNFIHSNQLNTEIQTWKICFCFAQRKKRFLLICRSKPLFPPKQMLGLPLLHHQPSLISPRTLLPKLLPRAFYPPNHWLHFPSLPQVLPRNASGFPRRFLGCSCSNISVCSSPDDDFDVELGRLLALLPEEMRRRVSELPELHQLIEVVMDLGRKPLARFPSGDFVISDYPITLQDIELATSQVFETMPTTCLINWLKKISCTIVTTVGIVV